METPQRLANRLPSSQGGGGFQMRRGGLIYPRSHGGPVHATPVEEEASCDEAGPSPSEPPTDRGRLLRGRPASSR
jgi:hypothetical protein